MKSSFRTTPDGFEFQPARRAIGRHLHRQGHVSIVLQGGYLEASDQGRRCLKPGDILTHEPFEAHANAISQSGAAIISLKLPDAGNDCWRQGRVRDLDSIIHLAERDVPEVWLLASESTDPGVVWEADWPDLLASALRQDPQLRITAWAEEHGLAPESVSRGFRMAYGVSPKRFRATNRARAAWRGLITGLTVGDAVATFGFSDQAHLCREVRALTGATPGFWRNKSVQYAGMSTR